MHTTRAFGATATLFAVLAAAGCGGSSGGATSTSAPSSTHSTKAGIASGEPAPPGGTSSSSATKASSTKAEPTAKSTAAGAPGVPEAARQHTKAGGNAFVKHYLGLINETAVRPKAGVLEPLAEPSCNSCDNYEKTVNNLVKNNRTFSGPEIAIISIANIGYQKSMANVEAHVKENDVNIVEKNGDIVKSFPAKDDDGVVFKLIWRNGWRVAAVQPMSQ